MNKFNKGIDYYNDYNMCRMLERNDNLGYFVIFDRKTGQSYSRWIQIEQDEILNKEYIELACDYDKLTYKIFAK